MADVYPGLDDLDDEVWIPGATERGWVLLTKDKAIRRNHREHEAVRRARARMFCIASGNLLAPQMADRLIANKRAIFARCRTPGPYIWSVHPKHLELIYPQR
jgi:PIN domain-containing protein